MTPLAAYLAKQLILRPKHREHIWVEPKNLKHLRKALDDIHCFEITECLPLGFELGNTFKRQGEEQAERMFETFAFLPAPKTWLEWRHGSGNRVAVLLEEIKNDNWVLATFFCDMIATNLGKLSTNSGDFFDCGGERAMPTYITRYGGNPAAAFLQTAHIMLLVINSPKIIGRRQHMPNVGLERRLTQGLGAGSFPLNAWTEILLQVNKPMEIDDGEPHEAHLTGKRALHFCRKHIRIRCGRLEYVSAHWRGDPAIGIKQSRYRVSA